MKFLLSNKEENIDKTDLTVYFSNKLAINFNSFVPSRK
jgi:hypothetical protein